MSCINKVNPVYEIKIFFHFISLLGWLLTRGDLVTSGFRRHFQRTNLSCHTGSFFKTLLLLHLLGDFTDILVKTRSPCPFYGVCFFWRKNEKWGLGVQLKPHFSMVMYIIKNVFVNAVSHTFFYRSFSFFAYIIEMPFVIYDTIFVPKFQF